MVSADVIRDLQQLLGARATVADSVREYHSHGESYHSPALPDVVCLVETTEEVSGICRISALHGVPVIPFGAGTSLEGHVQATHGGITIDLSGMKRILRTSVEDLDVTVEAGVTRSQLNKALRNTGLTFFIDPGADCTLGGMTATRASGTTAVRYGTMRDNVLGLTVVLADGRVIHTGGRARKSSAGYDLTRLFVGSEGTLGVITEITVRLFGRPEAVSAAVCAFDSIDEAVRAVIQTIQFGIPVARIELMDEVQIDAVNRYSKLSYAVKPTLLFEFHATSEAGAAEHATAVQEIAAEHGGTEFRWATTTEDRATLWAARHNTYYAALAMRPGGKAWVTDVCVPISALAECIAETKRELAASRAYAPLVGHVGDGNFHLNFVLDPNDPREVEEVKALNARLVARALRLGGTCTGEHGIGLGKQKYLVDEHGEDAVGVMRALKQALDPAGLMNPGKIF